MWAPIHNTSDTGHPDRGVKICIDLYADVMRVRKDVTGSGYPCALRRRGTITEPSGPLCLRWGSTGIIIIIFRADAIAIIFLEPTSGADAAFAPSVYVIKMTQ